MSEQYAQQPAGQPVKGPGQMGAGRSEFITGSSYLQTGRKTSIVYRIIALLVVMVLLILLPSLVNLWFSARASAITQEIRQASEYGVQVSQMQVQWLKVVSALESISATEVSAEANARMDTTLTEMEGGLIGLSRLELGLTPETLSDNALITNELVQIGADMRALSQEVYDLTARYRWSEALNRRNSGLPELTTRLESALTRLNQNQSSDLAVKTQELESLRSTASWLSNAAVILGVIFAGIFIYLALRMVVRPLRRMTGDVERISQGDFSPVIPLNRNDELGELSNAIALMTGWLREFYEAMEQRVAERTKEVERRRAELEVAAQVARDISSTRNLETLLNVAVNLVRDRFGFYHAGLFLNDNRNEYAVLRAATGDAGREMLSRRHQLRIGQVGLVGVAAQTGEPRLASDVGRDAAHFRNPLLPGTRSEAAIPLKSGGRVIGVLDVQSTQPQAFDKESLNVLGVLADQLATAIQNARLLEEEQQNLTELQTAYGQVDQQAWDRFTRSNPVVGYQFDGVRVGPVLRTEGQDGPAHRPAQTNTSTGGMGERVSLPLQVRGSTIGELEVWAKEGELAEGDRILLNGIAVRLSQIMESARLFEEAQARASREQTINRLTSSIARSLDTDSVLRTATLQLGELPAVVEASIFIGAPSGGDARAVQNTAAVENTAMSEFQPRPDSVNESGANESGANEGGGNGHRS